MTTEDIIGHLNLLIETSLDGELGYRTAAEHVHNTQLQAVFAAYAKQRARFVDQLQAEVLRLGGAAAVSGSLVAAMHRGWIDVKAAFSGGDGSAIVAACETGEGAALATYEKVLDMDVSGETRALVNAQFSQVQEAHKHMLRLKQSTITTGNSPKAQTSKGEA